MTSAVFSTDCNKQSKKGYFSVYEMFYMKEKETTIYDLASKLNISPATVSRGLKDHPAIKMATKQRIKDLAREMNYRSNNFASNLRKQQTNTIGVIVGKLNSNFMSTAIAGIENVANQAGYNIIISQSLESYKKEIASAETMFNNRVDGLLVSLAFDTDNINHFEPFFKKEIPVLFFDRVAEHSCCTNVLIDNWKAAYDATAHLAAQGCKKIVHITAIIKRNVYIDRLNGYKQALADNNLVFDERNVIIGNLTQEAGVNAAEIIKSMEQPPDGVFVSNDNCAVACMKTLKQAGFNIPKDIAFVGFNNDPLSRVIEPNLTTIDYKGFQMGEVAAQKLIGHLSGVDTLGITDRIILRSELIIRESSNHLGK